MELKIYMRKWEKFESDFSRLIHQSEIPVLVSSLVLRSKNAGQVDVASLSKIRQKWLLTLYEVKSNQIPNKNQWQRLKKAQD